jgi:sterol desaturase/sphingolipid hydroxylase (fatty acid hydroxylase superfamily)
MQETLSQLPPLILVAAYALFWAWEALYAARQQPAARGRRGRNLGLSAMCIVIAAASGTAVLWVSALVGQERWGLMQLVDVQPVLACVAGILLLDLTDYARHRFTHAVPLLWRLHRVHQPPMWRST